MFNKVLKIFYDLRDKYPDIFIFSWLLLFIILNRACRLKLIFLNHSESN